MSRITTLCLRIAIAILVQQKIFECAEQCRCKCRSNKYICDEINFLKVNDDVIIGQWKIWERHFKYLEILHEEFNHEVMIEQMNSLEMMARILEERINEISEESASRDFKVWTEKINSVENKTESIEGLKRRLDEAESRAERLETALENAKKDLKINIHSIEGRLCLVENQTNCFVPTIEAEIVAREGMEMNISRIEERMLVVENETNSFEPTTEAEKGAREEMEMT